MLFFRYVGLLALFAAVAPAVAQAPSGWLCTTDKTTGFSYSEGAWISVDFAARPRYLITPGPSGKPLWEIRPDGRAKVLEASCADDFSRLEVLHCESVVTEFKFNRKTGRFLKAYLAGYWSYTPNAPFFGQDGRDSPSIEIGTCSPL